MRSNRYACGLLLAALALAGLVATGCTPAGQQPAAPTTTETPSAGAMSFTTDLAPVEGVTTSATGSAKVDINGESGTFTVTVEGLKDVNMAHIHVAAEPGGSGPPALWLYPSTQQQPELKAGVTNGELSSGTFDATKFVGPLQGKTMADLVTAIQEGKAYVNVHTQANPNGEISGVLK